MNKKTQKKLCLISGSNSPNKPQNENSKLRWLCLNEQKAWTDKNLILGVWSSLQFFKEIDIQGVRKLRMGDET